jgi:hypothetical protein
MDRRQALAFAAMLGDDFYADADALVRAAAERSTVNLIHRATSIKIDLFVARSFLDRQQLERRRHVEITQDPRRSLFMHSPEDIVLQKLHWYRIGGHVSDRQWRDVLSVLLVQGPALDRGYLIATAGAAGLSDLLDRAFAEAARAR